MPSSSPRRRSRTTASGRVRRSAAIICSPFSAVPTQTNPGSARSTASRPARSTGWSSTTSTRIIERMIVARGTHPARTVNPRRPVLGSAAMPIPPVLRALPARRRPVRLRDGPAARLPRRGRRVLRGLRGRDGHVVRARSRNRRRPDGGDRRPHRRDRRDRHPHRRQGLPVLHRRRRLGRADRRRPAAEITTRDGVVPGVVGRKPIHCCATTTARRPSSSRTCTSTSAPATASRPAAWFASVTSR